MATGIILELLDAHRNNQSDCFIRVFRYDCSIRVISELSFILFTIVDCQDLAMLLEVILVSFNESISKTTEIFMIIIMTMMMHFILSWVLFPLSPTIICSNKGRKNNNKNKR